MVRALNKLAQTRPSIRGDDVREISNPDESVVTLARRSEGGDDSPHLWVMNLSSEQKQVRMSVQELQRELGWSPDGAKSVKDLLFESMNGRSRLPEIKLDGDTVELTVGPDDYMILENR
jgi:hypothetical protein